jgi:hypothetical protein
VLAALGLVLAGCGGSSSSAPAPSTTVGTTASSTTPSPTGGQVSQSVRSAVTAYVSCLRDQGFTIPTPSFSSGARGLFGVLRQEGTKLRTNPKFVKAETKCRPLIAAATPQITPAQRQRFQQERLKFAQCMKKNGVTVPTPTFTPGRGATGFRGPTGFRGATGFRGPTGRRGFGGGFLGGLNRNDPKVKKALQACQALLPSFGGFGGGSGAGAAAS